MLEVQSTLDDLIDICTTPDGRRIRVLEHVTSNDQAYVHTDRCQPRYGFKRNKMLKHWVWLTWSDLHVRNCIEQLR